MSKFSRSALGGLLFSVWAMCFVFPISLVMGFADHTPVAQILVQQIFNFVFLWFVCSALAYTVIGMFDDINKRPGDKPADDKREDRKQEKKDDEPK